MNIPALDRISREIARSRSNVNHNAAAVCSGPTCPSKVLGTELAIGARVLDLETGLEGVILDARKAHLLVSPSEGANS